MRTDVSRICFADIRIGVAAARTTMPGKQVSAVAVEKC